MPPVVLGIDTSSSWCSAAVVRGREIYATRAEVGNAHSDHLLSMVHTVLAEAGIALDRCDALAYSAGPGSFTGLRVGCAAAQGLAYGASLPVAAVGSLEAMAQSLVRDELARDGSVLVVQDARMGEVYWALYDRCDDGWLAIVEPSLAAPTALSAALAAIDRVPSVGCGNAWSVHDDALRGIVERVVPRASADAVDVASLGVSACRRQKLIAADIASLIYVRNDVARTTVERQADAAAGARLPMRAA